MAQKSPDVAGQLGALPKMTARELRSLWSRAIGNPPTHLRKEFLLRALSYHFQEDLHGGLELSVRRQLLRYAEELRAKGRIAAFNHPRLKHGTRLVRTWGGHAHVVTVLDQGYDYGGRRFASLSAISRAITGNKCSGFAFFGLRGRK